MDGISLKLLQGIVGECAPLISIDYEKIKMLQSIKKRIENDLHVCGNCGWRSSLSTGSTYVVYRLFTDSMLSPTEPDGWIGGTNTSIDVFIPLRVSKENRLARNEIIVTRPVRCRRNYFSNEFVFSLKHPGHRPSAHSEFAKFWNTVPKVQYTQKQI